MFEKLVADTLAAYLGDYVSGTSPPLPGISPNFFDARCTAQLS